MKKESTTLAITGANIIDTAKKTVYENSTIICSNEKIVSVSPTESITLPENAKQLNIHGKYILPGLIDAHVHLGLPAVDGYERMLYDPIKKKYLHNSLLTIKSGVTTVRNMPSGHGWHIFKFRKEADAGKFPAPRIVASGPALSPSYGYFSIKGYVPAPPSLIPLISRIFGIHGLSIDVDTPQDVPAVIKKLKEGGVDFIKTTTPGSAFDVAPEYRELLLKEKVPPHLINAAMKPEVLEEIVKCAHEAGLKVAAHTIGLPEHFKQGINAGLDSIEHTPFGLIDEETLQKMKESGVCWIPTAYTLINAADLIKTPEKFDSLEFKTAIPEPYYSIGRKALHKKSESVKNGSDPIWAKLINEIAPKYESEYFPENFRNAIKHGIKIAAGTDAGAGGAGWVPHGNLYKELELYAKHGMDEYEALQTATLNAAEILGVSDTVGSISPGKFADFVVLNTNPIKNISNLRDVAHVIKGGKQIF